MQQEDSPDPLSPSPSWADSAGGNQKLVSKNWLLAAQA